MSTAPESVQIVIAKAASLLVDRGYHKAGIDKLAAMRSEVWALLKHNDTSVFTDEDYVAQCVIPAIDACPESFRSTYAEWRKQFNLCLQLCRGEGKFVNIWEKPTSKRAMAPVSESSEPIQGGTRKVDW